MKTYLFGLLTGAALATASVVAYARSIDATPVYQSGFADGFAAAREPLTDMECQTAFGESF